MYPLGSPTLLQEYYVEINEHAQGIVIFPRKGNLRVQKSLIDDASVIKTCHTCKDLRYFWVLPDKHSSMRKIVDVKFMIDK